LKAQFPVERAAFLCDPATHFLPGGEPSAEAVHRARTVLNEIAYAAGPEARILVVATVGLVGYGAIGHIVARILKGFGSTVLALRSLREARLRRRRRASLNRRTSSALERHLAPRPRNSRVARHDRRKANRADA
jgi:hypothetical protein